MWKVCVCIYISHLYIPIAFPNIFVTYRPADAKPNSRYTILMTMPKNCHANIKDGRESIKKGLIRMRHPKGIVSDCIAEDQKTMGKRHGSSGSTAHVTEAESIWTARAVAKQ